ncbi:FAD/FMN-dependent dehydrogenase [Desulfocurvibacter africanus PCS]|uniref:FAD/FMN-dependent dehydrogenase n=1 Tax=Desulfocurvibacter africanus PCS TaxID=1262666 RepID=M5PR51_DESAF|nr:D-arabinono-1,4-lactone oxidase [Desulfocurvibacter africanus]EMG36867.1 FAD/FMN-dependent dehydrogenase [Desulfocurvibacter africanus PCS]
MPREWSNWSGSLRFTPGSVETPADEQELRALVIQAGEDGRSVRVAGAGRSSTPLAATEHVLVSMEHFQGLVTHDAQENEVTVRAGITLKRAGRIFHDLGLAMANPGDADPQSLAGAVGTGAHGTGKDLRILSSHLVGGRMVTGGGPIVAFDIEDDIEFVNMLRVSLGTLGIFTELRLRLLPAFELERREWCTHIEGCLAHLDELIEGNRNFDFYWYPRSDEAKLRTLNPPGQGMRDIPYATLRKETRGYSHELIPRHRKLKFDEMEYFLPRKAGPECFREMRRRVRERWRKDAAWRVLYRTVAADDYHLSPATGRDSATISLHHKAGLSFKDAFEDIEPIFRHFGGRPHWAKQHSLRAEELRPMYPGWEEFLRMRKCLDPDGVLLNPYLRELLGVSPA